MLVMLRRLLGNAVTRQRHLFRFLYLELQEKNKTYLTKDYVS